MSGRLLELYGLAKSGAGVPLILAPMAGYTSAAMRKLCNLEGADLCYTEMVSARGLLHPGRKSWQLLETLPGEGPVVAHLYGSEPGYLAEASGLVAHTQRFVGLDLNAGCPVRKVTASGAGAALIKKPDLVYTLLSAMCCATDLPVTLKTRLGPHPDHPLIWEVMQAAEEAGAAAIAIHARFTTQGHGGTTTLDLLAEIKANARIPVLGNGGINSGYAARQMWEQTGVDGLMVARGAIGNPWIFQEVATALQSPESVCLSAPLPDFAMVKAMLDKHIALEAELYQQCCVAYPEIRKRSTIDTYIVGVFRTHLFRYLRGVQGASQLRGNLHKLKTIKDIKSWWL